MEEKHRKMAERSSFAVKCSLFSQYLKENRSFGDQLGIQRLHCAPEIEKGSFRPPTTMYLFPGSDISAEAQNEPELDVVSEQSATMPVDRSALIQDTVVIPKAAKRAEQNEGKANAQLTILYDGKVMVFDSFPAKKALDLMAMASKSTSFLPASEIPPIISNPCASDRTMPIARRASLHRFLEKRKDRIKSNAPYSLHGSTEPESASTTPEKSRAWLTLGRATSFVKPN